MFSVARFILHHLMQKQDERNLDEGFFIVVIIQFCLCFSYDPNNILVYTSQLLFIHFISMYYFPFLCRLMYANINLFDKQKQDHPHF